MRNDFNRQRIVKINQPSEIEIEKWNQTNWNRGSRGDGEKCERKWRIKLIMQVQHPIKCFTGNISIIDHFLWPPLRPQLKVLRPDVFTTPQNIYWTFPRKLHNRSRLKSKKPLEEKINQRDRCWLEANKRSPKVLKATGKSRLWFLQ